MAKRQPGRQFSTYFKNLITKLIKKKSKSALKATPSLQYLPLESESHFRILYLNPGADHEPLSGSLVHSNLNEQPHPVYDCLSYTWGEPTLSYEVWIDGARSFITSNLNSALRRIRSRSSEPIPIWADGICINQGDISERNQQVSLMRRIYSECQTGLIYLGEGADGSDTVPEFMEVLANSIARLLRKNPNPVYFDPENEDYLPKKEDPGWKALMDLLNRPWFRRVWVIQEFALPPDILMLFGKWELPGCYIASIMNVQFWKYSRDALTAVTDDDLGGPTITISIQHMHLQTRISARKPLGLGLDETFEKSTERRAKFYESLVWLLHNTWMCLATDPRDKYFALTALASDGAHPALTPDYSKSLQTVAIEYGEHFVREGYGLTLLTSKDPATQVIGLPSWVTNWATFQETGSSFYVWSTKYDPNFDVQIESMPGTGKITVTGYFVDDIQRLSAAMVFPAWFTWIEDVEDLLGDVQNYPSGKSLEEALWRTIIGDKAVGSDSPAPDQYESYYKDIRGIDTNETIATRMRSTSPTMKQILALDTAFIFNAALLKYSKFMLTGRNLFGMLPEQAELGDGIFMLKGDQENYTFLVRKDPELDQYRLVGHAYIYDIWKVLRVDELEEVKIVIC